MSKFCIQTLIRAACVNGAVLARFESVFAEYTGLDPGTSKLPAWVLEVGKYIACEKATNGLQLESAKEWVRDKYGGILQGESTDIKLLFE